MSRLDLSRLHLAIDPMMLEACEAISRYYPVDPAQVQTKADQSPVTLADLAAHHQVQTGLARRFPQLPLISEESDPASQAEREGYDTYWLLDPLDGTREFLAGNGEFAVCLALMRGHEPVWGMIAAPSLGWLYWGGPGLGAWRRPADGQAEPIHTRTLAPGRPLRVLVSHRASHSPDGQLARLAQLWPDGVEQVPMGSALKCCRIAEGAADAYLRPGPTCHWDTAAAQAILHGAGGRLCTWDGQAMDYRPRQDFLNPPFVALGDPAAPWGSWLSW